MDKVAEAGSLRLVTSHYAEREFLTVDESVDGAGDNWSFRMGDEVRITEGQHAGLYATVIAVRTEALVEFPDRRRSIIPTGSLVLVLRPAPDASNAIRAAELIREAFDP